MGEKNYYSILNVRSDASDDEIRKAYASMIKKYPPQKCPDEFQNIRRAYEVLINKASRDEYDNNLKSGGEIGQLEEKGDKYMQSKQYDEAILCYKKMLLINPRLATIRNRLGICYCNKEDYNTALTNFKKAISIDPDNPLYYCNAAYALSVNKDIKGAADYYNKTLLVDSKYKDAYTGLAEIYYQEDEYDKAIELLKRAVKINSDIDNLECYVKLIYSYVASGKYSMIPSLKQDIYNFAGDGEELRDYVIHNLLEITQVLDNKGYKDAAFYVSDIAYELSPQDSKLIEIRKFLADRKSVAEELERMENDSSILQSMYLMMLYYETPDSEIGNEDEVNKVQSKLIENLNYDLRYNYSRIILNCDRIKNSYSTIYSRNKNFFDAVYKRAISNRDDPPGFLGKVFKFFNNL